ncbi:MAG: hypothetical protein IE933_10260 [Sphingomonadales bacterium]|nr:hypothetical protein [Sphingomonadales bacterium]MBD3772917.1 hypothetical protein [Paracoccaceae bacterium]
MSLFSLLPLILQVGVAPSVGAVSDLPQEMRDRQAIERRRASEAIPAAPAGPTMLEKCLTLARSDAAAAKSLASSWIGQTQGRDKAEAGHCLGFAESQLEQWGAARTAFADARLQVPDSEHAYRARLGAMAGNAAMAAGDNNGALPLFNAAQSDARASGEGALLADIAIDRAMALVAVGNLAEAAQVLDEARAGDPANARAWLLSATLSRRMEHMAQAQAQIEEAARLAPRDPEVGLEAGLIAALTGRDAAARQSWNSVIAIAPDSAAAATARDYLAQLDQGG